jgi:hypothetical protein
MNPISPNRTFNNGNSFNRQTANQSSTYSARREPVRQSMASLNMAQPQGASSMNPSITNSYQRITGGTPTITVSNPGPNFKSKTQVALENYAAEKAVEEQKFKDAYIGQYGKAGYEMYVEAMKTRDEQQKAQQDLYKKMGPPSDYQRGLAQAQEQKAASERAQNFRSGLNVGRNGFQFPS